MGQENDRKTSASVATGTSFAIISTTCCALPLVLVSLGLGGAVASMVSTVPFLVTLSKYKAITFAVTGLMLGYSWFLVRRVSQCDIADAKRLKWQKMLLWFSTILLGISIFVAYALLPIVQYFEG